MRKRAAVLGASGYTGREVLRLLASHPGLRVELLMSARPGVAPEPPATSYDPVIAPLDVDRLRLVDGVFLCTPHGAAAELARAALAAGCKVVDLSADFRLKDPAVHAATYGGEHQAPDLLAEAVYGLTERARAHVANARLCANPGCYPTAVSLPLLPLLDAGLLDVEAGIVADCKSGVSGAGGTPSARTHFGSVHENFLAYGVGDHRHAPEIRQTCGTPVVFVPHLLPVFRGILATIYAVPRAGVTAADAFACLDEAYGAEPFVRLYERGLPELNRVQRTNYCDIAVRTVGDRLVLISAIDNLVKGAAGQAVQNMNLMLGLPEEAGLA
jgi:N-acetyl-gamma-glutamyl-phosphate reductase